MKILGFLLTDIILISVLFPINSVSTTEPEETCTIPGFMVDTDSNWENETLPPAVFSQKNLLRLSLNARFLFAACHNNFLLRHANLKNCSGKIILRGKGIHHDTIIIFNRATLNYNLVPFTVKFSGADHHSFHRKRNQSTRGCPKTSWRPLATPRPQHLPLFSRFLNFFTALKFALKKTKQTTTPPHIIVTEGIYATFLTSL